MPVLHVLVLALGAGAAVTRMMPNTNFHGHNLPNEGCSPVVPSKFTTPTACEAACDALAACDMWTFVAVPTVVAAAVEIQPGEGAAGPTPARPVPILYLMS